MKGAVVHVTGARPNFPKAAPVMRELESLGVDQRLVHTGQHYDEAMCGIFFRQLALRKPDVDLNVRSGSHASQTAAIMTGLEHLFTQQPGLVVVYGDVNSTVAAALVAAKLRVPVAHVEAGLRSFDRSMPEEVNRIVTDRLSDLLFATSEDAVEQLILEGEAPHKIHFVGNPMIDSLLGNLDRFDVAKIRHDLQLPAQFVVATLHRPGNVDEDKDVAELVESFHAVADDVTVVLPLHPRGRARLAAAGMFTHPKVLGLEPLGYVEFLSLVRGALAVITDSGGVQEETTFLGVPCFTLRPNTERPVTISHGTNHLVTRADLPFVVRQSRLPQQQTGHPIPPLWDGRSGSRIAAVIAKFVSEPRG